MIEIVLVGAILLFMMFYTKRIDKNQFIDCINILEKQYNMW